MFHGIFSLEPKEAKLICKKKKDEHDRYKEMPRRAVHVDSGRYRHNDKHTYKAVPGRAHNDDGRLYAVPTALILLTDKCPIQRANQTQ
jgi:hypothetical protein